MTREGDSSVRDLFRPLFRRLPELVTLSVFVNLLALAVPIFVLQVYDRVVFQAGLTTLQGLIVGVGLAIAFDFVLRQARARLVQRVAVRIDVATGRTLIRKLTALPLRVLESQTAAQWQALTRDAEAVRDTVAGPPVVLAIDLPFVVLFAVLIALIAPPLAWVLAALIPLFLIASAVSAWRIGKSTTQERDSALERDAVLVDMVAGRTTVKALGLGPALAERWADRHATSVTQSIRRATYVDGSSNLGMSLGLIATVAMTGVGALAIIEGTLTIGALIAANMLTNRVVGPLNQTVGAWRQVVRFRQSLARLAELFAQADEARAPTIARPRPKGRLTLEGVVFAYDPAKGAAVDGIDLDLGPGGVHGIVGPNGGGKTTLLKLCQGLYAPGEGRVLIDGADMRQFSRAELADWIGYVPQDPFLFSGSIRDNIAMGREGLSDAAILKAAEDAGAAGFIADLPDGFATDIGENGRLFSAGQRQRLALARAFAGDPPVLLLDEPSAHLDRNAERDLARALARLGRARTVLVVSHGQALLKSARTLSVIDAGKLAAHGPAEEVLRDFFGIGSEAAGAPGPAPKGPPLRRVGGKPRLAATGAPVKKRGGGDE